MRHARQPVTDTRGDRGITIILVAVFMIALLMMVAVVVDVSMIRADRRSNKSVADFAVTAGAQDLDQNPWAAVCSAYEYLKGQGEAPATTPEATNGAGTSISFTTACNGGVKPKCTTDPSSWARLVARSSDGKVVVTIESAYDAAGDPQFASEEAKLVGDPGVPCEQLGITISETRTPAFARVMGFGDETSLIRSVSRREPGDLRHPAALILLERRNCNVLQTGGSATKVVAQPIGDIPGIIQIDSDATGSCSSQAIINGQSSSSGPSILACSAAQTNYGCVPSPGAQPRDSIVGVYAALTNPGGNIAPAFSGGTYGDTPYQGSLQFTRGPVDERHRTFVRSLDLTVRTLFAGAALSNPPGCGPVNPVSRNCVDTTTSPPSTWLVISGADCAPASATLLATTAVNVWFKCSDNPGRYAIDAPLALPLAQTVVFNNGGTVDLSSTLTIPYARTVYVRGGSTAIGLQVGNGGRLVLNNALAASCAAASPSDSATFVVFQGQYSTSSGGSAQTCETFVYLASGGSKVPSSDGTAPCPSTDNALACGAYSGSISIGSNSSVDWTAPNEVSIPACRPDLLTGCYTPSAALAFEDLALWTEAATNNVITGGGVTSLGGVFFLPNADEFTLAGGGALPIKLDAQFIVRKLKVTGGATVTLTPDVNSSFTVRLPSTVLVR